MQLSLDELAATPERAIYLTPAERQTVLLKCASIQSALAAVVMPDDSGDRLLGVEEAAVILGWEVETLRHRKKSVPFRVDTGARKLLFSYQGIQRFIKR